MKKIVMHDVGVIPPRDMKKIAKRESLRQQFDTGTLRDPQTTALVTSKSHLDRIYKLLGL